MDIFQFKTLPNSPRDHGVMDRALAFKASGPGSNPAIPNVSFFPLRYKGVESLEVAQDKHLFRNLWALYFSFQNLT